MDGKLLMLAEQKAVPGSLPNSSVDPGKHHTKPDRASRLPSSSDYSFVFADAIAVHTQSFTILSRACDQANSRLGLVVSKKNTGRAVSRNLLKRVIRESFRTHRELLPKVDIIVLTKKGADKKNNKELFTDLLSGWHKLANKYTS